MEYVVSAIFGIALLFVLFLFLKSYFSAKKNGVAVEATVKSIERKDIRDKKNNIINTEIEIICEFDYYGRHELKLYHNMTNGHKSELEKIKVGTVLDCIYDEKRDYLFTRNNVKGMKILSIITIIIFLFMIVPSIIFPFLFYKFQKYVEDNFPNENITYVEENTEEQNTEEQPNEIIDDKTEEIRRAEEEEKIDLSNNEESIEENTAKSESSDFKDLGYGWLILIFIVIEAGPVYKYVSIRKKEKEELSKNYIKLMGRVVDYHVDTRTSDDTSIDIYAPEIEYNFNGKDRKYVSKFWSTNKKYKIGQEIEINVDCETGNVYEKEGKGYWLFAIIFFVIIFGITFYMKIKG